MMRENCGTHELGLVPSSGCSSVTLDLNKDGGQEQMTIFYNGRICVCDVTEVQARSIIQFASQKADKEGIDRSLVGAKNPMSSTLQSQQLYSPTGISMKRSLQRFLKKRNHRLQALSPYYRSARVLA